VLDLNRIGRARKSHYGILSFVNSVERLYFRPAFRAAQSRVFWQRPSPAA
jgi:hypothetical protein